MSTGEAGVPGTGGTAPTRDEVKTAIDEAVGDASTRLEKMMAEKMEGFMDALSRLVPETPPAAGTAAGGGGESREGMHASPGAGREDQAPNTGRGVEGARGGLLGPVPQESTPSEGNVSRDGMNSEHRARYTTTSHARIPRLKQLNFDGHEKNWPMFQNEFTTQVQTCGMTRALTDSRDIVVQGVDDEGMVGQGVKFDEISMYRDLWGMLTGAISDNTTKMMVFGCKGPSAAWRALVETFSPLTGGEQISLMGKFFSARQEKKQDPPVFFQEFKSIVTSLEIAFDQPIPKMLVYTRFLDGLSIDFDVQKQQLLAQKTLDEEEILRVLRARSGQLKVEETNGKSDRRAQHAFVAVAAKGKGKRRSKLGRGGDEEACLANGKNSVKCYICDGDHYVSECPEQRCQKCGGKGHNVKYCPSKYEKGGATAVCAVELDVDELDVACSAL
ncbi:unnamed protein product [Ectocarpus sp. CCAP 1310/34]|nr:unnamed protein product [Ectocarpus sp. CCAP 1310/34]